MKELKRISTVVFVDADDLTAKEIQGAMEAFVKTNYKSVVEKVETHYRPVFIKDYVKKVEQ